MKKYLLFLIGLLLVLVLSSFQAFLQRNQVSAEDIKLPPQDPIKVKVEHPEWTKDATLAKEQER
jgi:hypothetical protein